MTSGGARRFNRPFVITCLTLACSVGVALWISYFPWRWERTKEELRKKFPGVRRIDGEDLRHWIEVSPEPKPVLIDVRSQPAFEFSHLPGAMNMAVSETPAKFGMAAGSNESFVIYDQVGKDSFAVAHSLLQRGYARIYVLEGGIFEWANRGGTMAGPVGPSAQLRVDGNEFTGLLRSHARAGK